MSCPTHNSGAQSFIELLEDSICESFSDSLNILLPNGEGAGYRKGNIARLDGCYFYDFSSRNIRNYIELTRGYRLKLPFPSFSMFNTHLNRHLNRHIREAVEFSDGIVFQSELSKKMYMTFIGDIKKPSCVISNGAKFHGSGNIQMKGRHTTLAITASFRPHKRLASAVALVNYLNGRSSRSYSLVVFGDIDPVTLRFLKEYDLSAVRFFGRMARDQILEFYKIEGPVGLSPSIFDPCPNSVVEMMSVGVPVLTTSASGAAELLQRDSNYVVNEDVELTFFEQQTPSCIPKISLEQWAQKVESVGSNYKYHSDAISSIFEKHLEINIIARKYYEFRQKLSG